MAPDGLPFDWVELEDPMGVHYLHKVFAPKSIAVIGATTRTDSVGYRVFMNMVDAGFQGDLYPVNPKYEEIAGKRCYPSVKAIGKPVDVAVVVIPAKTVPALIRECGE